MFTTQKPEWGALRAQIEQLRDEPTHAPALLSAKRKTVAIEVDER